mgnify:CR=1 FL=1
MKAIKYLSMLALLFTTATSCMSNFDEPKFDQPPFGNNEIGEANTTIAELKDKLGETQARLDRLEQFTHRLYDEFVEHTRRYH